MKTKIVLVSLLFTTLFSACKKNPPATPNPVAAFDGSVEMVIGVPQVFINKSTNAESYFWKVTPTTGVDIQLQQKDAKITFSQAGDYEVELTASSNGKPNSIIKKVVKVNATQSNDFTYKFRDIGIVPVKAKFEVTNSQPGETYEWSITGGFAVTGDPASPDSVNFTAAGDYVVKLTTIKNGIRSTATEKTIKLLPAPDFTAVIDPNFSPTRLTLTNTSVVANFDSFRWDIDGTSPAGFISPMTKLFYDGQGKQVTVRLIAFKDGFARTSVKLVSTNDPYLSIFYPFTRTGTSSLANLADSSGNSRNGFVSTAAPLAVPDRFSGPAPANTMNASGYSGSLSFNMPQGSLRDAFSIRKEGTISLWFRSSDLAQSGVLIGAYSDQSEVIAPIIYYSGNDARIRAQWPANGKIPMESAPLTNTTTWHHIVLTYKNKTHLLYMDGVAVGRIDDLEGTFENGQIIVRNAEIGRGNILGWSGAGNQSVVFAFGAIDDLRVYSKALTLDEITALKNQ